MDPLDTQVFCGTFPVNIYQTQVTWKNLFLACAYLKAIIQINIMVLRVETTNFLRDCWCWHTCQVTIISSNKTHKVFFEKSFLMKLSFPRFAFVLRSITDVEFSQRILSRIIPLSIDSNKVNALLAFSSGIQQMSSNSNSPQLHVVNCTSACRERSNF